jgi:hypothetical protein
MKTLHDLSDAILSYEETIKSARAKLTEVAMKTFASLPGKNIIVIIGHTPGFNDGDPCYHSQSTYVNGSWYTEQEDYEDGFGNAIDVFNELFPDYLEGETIEWGLDEALSDELSLLVDSLSDLYEDVYGTNFEVVITTNDGEVKVQNFDYEPGY